MNERPTPKISIEDLLHLKRTERPAPEFWAGFESQLRTKQLAAILEKRPWYNSLPQGLIRISRWSVPLGAAAAVAMTVGTVHLARRTPAGAEMAKSRPAAESQVSAVSSATPSILPAAVSVARDSVPSTELLVRPVSVAQASSGVQVAAAVEAVSPEQLGRLLVGLGHAAGNSSDVGTDSVAIPARVAAVSSQITPVSERVVAEDETPEAESRASSESVTRTVTVRGPRGQRLIADASAKEASGPTFDDNADVVRSRERIVNRLVERGFNDTYSRMGLGGDRVSVKF
jgi:hypothetical protein